MSFGEIGRLVVVHGHVATVGSCQLAVRKLFRHRGHVGGVHRVVLAGDHERWHLDSLQVGKPIPVHEPPARSHFAGPLHRHVECTIHFREVARKWFRPLDQQGVEGCAARTSWA